MFENVAAAATTNKIGTGLTSAGVAVGIILGIVKHKSFWGTFAYAVGFGLAGLAVGTVVGQLTNK